MTTLQELHNAIETFSEISNKYQTKPTKAESKRLRAAINEFKKNATSYKQLLLEADKAK